MKNKKGFTLVELLAVIVVLAIVMGLAVVAITGVLDNARKATFVADAKSFLEGAHNMVNTADLNNMMTGGTGTTYCGNAATTKYISIGAIKLQQGGQKSPYGNPYAGINDNTIGNSAPESSSYIKVDATARSAGECTYTFSIMLSDGVYNIPLTAENSLDTTVVAPLGS